METTSTTETLITKGKYDALVRITVSVFSHGTLIASAEDEHLTERQFIKAVQEAYSDFEIVGKGRVHGFWYADGERRRQ